MHYTMYIKILSYISLVSVCIQAILRYSILCKPAESHLCYSETHCIDTCRRLLFSEHVNAVGHTVCRAACIISVTHNISNSFPFVRRIISVKRASHEMP